MTPKKKLNKNAVSKKFKRTEGLHDDVSDLFTSPFHEIIKTGSYINKKGGQKGFAIFQEIDFSKKKNDHDVGKQINPIPIKNGFRQKISLYLNNAGDLYREPKSKYCYALRSERYKILKHFIDNKIYKFYPTKELAIDLGKNDNNLRKEINKINTLAKGKLGIKDNIIEGRQGSGYRLNPNYKITPKND